VTRHAPLLDFIPRVSPRYARPLHLAPLVGELEAVGRGEEVHTTVACPPRHAKTDTISHAIAWLLRLKPSLRVCYVTYAQTLSEKKSRRMRALAERARVQLDPKAASLHDWRTGVDDGGVWATSIGGPVTGEGFDLIIADDVVKDRVAAESGLVRERTHEWFTETLYPRLEPGGSVIVCMHRWHVDDLSGRLVADGWKEICLAALDQEGRALWPERYTAERLAIIREKIGEYAWWSLYQGRPQSRGGAVFADVHLYTELPRVFRIIIGIDLAYTAKTHADRSVAVVLAEAGGVFYVLDVIVKQVAAPDFASVLRTLRETYPTASFASYIGGTEKGVIDLFRSQGIPILGIPARADKFIRAQPTAAAWNAGRILVPGRFDEKGERLPGPAWVNPFVDVLCGFTGVNDKRDDEVDALVSGFDALVSGIVAAEHRRRLDRMNERYFATHGYDVRHDPGPSMWARFADARAQSGDEPPFWEMRIKGHA
jgi:predicted phage terminase large subunit-like protein